MASCSLLLEPAPAGALTTLRWILPADSAPARAFRIYKGPAPYSGELVDVVLPERDDSGVYSADVQIDEVDQGIPVFVWLTARNGVGESAPSNPNFYPPSCDQGLDADCDGVPDDGATGEVPCASGQTLGCDDNCPWWPNPDQDDRGGVGAASPPDGIGDACQCGDVNSDGEVTSADSIIIQRSLLEPPTAEMERPDLCDVGGALACSNADAVIVLRAQLTPPTATIAPQCVPALRP